MKEIETQIDLKADSYGDIYVNFKKQLFLRHVFIAAYILGALQNFVFKSINTPTENFRDKMHAVYRCILLFVYILLIGLMIYFTKMGFRFVKIFKDFSPDTNVKPINKILMGTCVLICFCFTFNIFNSVIALKVAWFEPEDSRCWDLFNQLQNIQICEEQLLSFLMSLLLRLFLDFNCRQYVKRKHQEEKANNNNNEDSSQANTIEHKFAMDLDSDSDSELRLNEEIEDESEKTRNRSSSEMQRSKSMSRR